MSAPVNRMLAVGAITTSRKEEPPVVTKLREHARKIESTAADQMVMLKKMLTAERTAGSKKTASWTSSNGSTVISRLANTNIFIAVRNEDL